jgi:hypothetical protein
VSLHGQISQESLHLLGSQLTWMALVEMKDKTPDPVDVGVFGANGVMFRANAASQLIEQSRCVRVSGRLVWAGRTTAGHLVSFALELGCEP